MVLLVTLVSSAVISLTYAHTNRQGWHALEAKSDKYAAYLHSSLEPPIWNFDDDSAVRIAQSFIKNDLIDSLLIIDSEGRVVLRAVGARPVQNRGTHCLTAAR